MVEIENAMKPKHLHKYSFRLTDEEQMAFARKLEQAGIGKSEFLRTLIQNVNVISRLNPEQMDCLRNLRNMSNNLNQIAKRANQNVDFLSLAVEVINTKNQIDVIINRINKQ